MPGDAFRPRRFDRGGAGRRGRDRRGCGRLLRRSRRRRRRRRHLLLAVLPRFLGRRRTRRAAGAGCAAATAGAARRREPIAAADEIPGGEPGEQAEHQRHRIRQNRRAGTLREVRIGRFGTRRPANMGVSAAYTGSSSAALLFLVIGSSSMRSSAKRPMATTGAREPRRPRFPVPLPGLRVSSSSNERRRRVEDLVELEVACVASDRRGSSCSISISSDSDRVRTAVGGGAGAACGGGGTLGLGRHDRGRRRYRGDLGDPARFGLPSRRRLQRAGERERASRSVAPDRRPSRGRGRRGAPRCAPRRAARRPARRFPRDVGRSAARR